MDVVQSLATGFSVALQPENLLFCFVGVLLGTLIGMLPGLGSASGVAILIPLTLTLDPVTALIMLAGFYYGTEYGATISAVLISTPGDGTSLITVIDGHQMALRGKAGQALAIAAISSFVAGTLSVVALSLVAPLFASVALNFGPPEMFALMAIGLLTIGGVIGGNPKKGIAMALFGALLAMVGMDNQTSQMRFTFGRTELFSGVDLIAVVIGIVALAEIITQGSGGNIRPIRARFREMMISRKDVRKSAPAIGRGGIIGFIVGVLPGAGPTLATFFAYDAERRAARGKGEFGRGDIRGVAAPEAAGNAGTIGSFVPTLTLGIPGSATTAVLLGAFILYNVQPGPLLFEEQPELVWGLIASFYIGNLILLVLNLPLAPVFASVLRLRYSYIYPVVLGVALVAAYAVTTRMFDAWLALGLAVFGVFMRRYGYPIAPVVLGLVLGGLMEAELRRALAMGGGSFTIFAERPISLALLGFAALLLIVPLVLSAVRRRRAGKKQDRPELTAR